MSSIRARVNTEYIPQNFMLSRMMGASGTQLLLSGVSNNQSVSSRFCNRSGKNTHGMWDDILYQGDKRGLNIYVYASSRSK